MPNKPDSSDPIGTFEAQTMVRRMKTYIIVDPELRNLWGSTLMANFLLFFATLAVGFAINCLLSEMALPKDTTLSASQETLFYWGPRAGFIVGAVFFAATIMAWAFGYSTIRNVRKTSREGKVISG